MLCNGCQRYLESEMYRDDDLPEKEIIARLQKKFDLTESEIRKYL